MACFTQRWTPPEAQRTPPRVPKTHRRPSSVIVAAYLSSPSSSLETPGQPTGEGNGCVVARQRKEIVALCFGFFVQKNTRGMQPGASGKKHVAINAARWREMLGQSNPSSTLPRVRVHRPDGKAAYPKSTPRSGETPPQAQAAASCPWHTRIPETFKERERTRRKSRKTETPTKHPPATTR